MNTDHNRETSHQRNSQHFNNHHQENDYDRSDQEYQVNLRNVNGPPVNQNHQTQNYGVKLKQVSYIGQGHNQLAHVEKTTINLIQTDDWRKASQSGRKRRLQLSRDKSVGNSFSKTPQQQLFLNQYAKSGTKPLKKEKKTEEQIEQSEITTNKMSERNVGKVKLTLENLEKLENVFSLKKKAEKIKVKGDQSIDSIKPFQEIDYLRVNRVVSKSPTKTNDIVLNSSPFSPQQLSASQLQNVLSLPNLDTDQLTSELVKKLNNLKETVLGNYDEVIDQFQQKVHELDHQFHSNKRRFNNTVISNYNSNLLNDYPKVRDPSPFFYDERTPSPDRNSQFLSDEAYLKAQELELRLQLQNAQRFSHQEYEKFYQLLLLQHKQLASRDTSLLVKNHASIQESATKPAVKIKDNWNPILPVIKNLVQERQTIDMDDDFEAQDREIQREKKKQQELERLKKEVEMHQSIKEDEAQKLKEFQSKIKPTAELNQVFTEYMSQSKQDDQAKLWEDMLNLMIKNNQLRKNEIMNSIVSKIDDNLTEAQLYNKNIQANSDMQQNIQFENRSVAETMVHKYLTKDIGIETDQVVFEMNGSRIENEDQKYQINNNREIHRESNYQHSQSQMSNLKSLGIQAVDDYSHQNLISQKSSYVQRYKTNLFSNKKKANQPRQSNTQNLSPIYQKSPKKQKTEFANQKNEGQNYNSGITDQIFKSSMQQSPNEDSARKSIFKTKRSYNSKMSQDRNEKGNQFQNATSRSISRTTKSPQKINTMNTRNPDEEEALDYVKILLRLIVKKPPEQIKDEISIQQIREAIFALPNGLPNTYRRSLWRHMMFNSAKLRLEQPKEAYIKHYSSQKAIQMNPNLAKITTDVLRTCQDLDHFKCDEISVQSSPLLKVLVAYGLSDREIGYTQGMNYVAAMLYHVFEDEYEAFLGLHYIMHVQRWRTMYLDRTPKLKSIIAEMNKRLLQEYPKIFNHFSSLNVQSESAYTQLFMALGYYNTRNMNMSISIQILDLFIIEGESILFNLILNCFKLNENKILGIKNDYDMYQYIQNQMIEETINKYGLRKVIFGNNG